MQDIVLKFDDENLITEIRQIIREELKQFIGSDKSDEEKYLTTDELIKELHITKPTLHRHRTMYNIPYKKVGRRCLFKLSEVIKAIDKKIYLRD